MRRPFTVALALAAVAAALLAAPALAAKDDLILISRAGGPAGAPVDSDAVDSSISAGGAQVAFDTEANNLSAEDNNTLVNIFVRDAFTDVTTLVSRATGVAGAAADGNSFGPAISSDGRFVAFESTADNLSAADNAFSDIFVRDLVANTTTLVSRASGPGGAGANGTSTASDISADGRYVVFQSDANNLFHGSTTTRSATSSCATWSPTRPPSSAADRARTGPAPTATPGPRRSRAAATASPSTRTRTTSPPRTTTAPRTSSCATSPPPPTPSSAARPAPPASGATPTPAPPTSRPRAASSPSGPTRTTCRATTTTPSPTSSCATSMSPPRRWRAARAAREGRAPTAPRPSPSCRTTVAWPSSRSQTTCLRRTTTASATSSCATRSRTPPSS